MTAWCASDNIAPKRTLEKAGMRLSGIVAGGLEVDGQWYDKIDNTYSDQESECVCYTRAIIMCYNSDR